LRRKAAEPSRRRASPSPPRGLRDPSRDGPCSPEPESRRTAAGFRLIRRFEEIVISSLVMVEGRRRSASPNNKTQTRRQDPDSARTASPGRLEQRGCSGMAPQSFSGLLASYRNVPSLDDGVIPIPAENSHESTFSGKSLF
jgi:hypothetical protein